MEDSTEEEFKSCLLKSFINELDETIELKVSSSRSNLHNTVGIFSENISTDSDDNNISNKNYLFSTLCLNKKILYLQKKLASELNANDITGIIKNLKNNFSNLIIGKHSNYFISDLIKKSTKRQKMTILGEIYSEIGKLAMTEYGSHPIQTFIERASSNEEITMLVNALSKRYFFVQVCIHPHGNFVIQKLLSFFSEQYREKINQLIFENILVLANNIHGVCVVQKYIFTCEQYQKLSLLTFVFSLNLLTLGTNQYGNYACQCLLKKVGLFPDLYQSLSNRILFNFFSLSTNQYGNHLVDIFLEGINKTEKWRIFDELYSLGVIHKLYNDKYGRYIIFKLLNIFEFSERSNILCLIKNAKLKVCDV